MHQDKFFFRVGYEALEIKGNHPDMVVSKETLLH